MYRKYIDAKASKITIEIENGGKTFIKITDNGVGINKEDLKLAPIQYATSKITELEDIYQTVSYGFRGEALASISHVANLEIQSKTKGDNAYSIKANNHEISSIIPTTHPEGTSIIIKDLFYEIPVRLKYLKTDKTEANYISECIHNFACIFPEIDFKFMNNNTEVLNTSGVNDIASVILNLYGKSFYKTAYPLIQQSQT